jgi:hypothetical protein
VRTVDDVRGDAPAREPAGVRTLEVVEAQVLGQLAAEPLEADLEVAREGRAPALFEDRVVERLDGAVRLRTSGADASRSRAELSKRLLEAAAELVPVIGQRPLEPPAGRLRSAATLRASFEVWAALGCPREQVTSSAQA